MDNKAFRPIATKNKRKAPSPPDNERAAKNKSEMSRNSQPKLNSLSFKLFQKNSKRNAPPRPPPPKFPNSVSRSKSLQLAPAKPKSTVTEMCLIDLSSPPNSPYGGSGSDGLSLRSFSSEASSSNQSSGLEEPFDPFGSIMDTAPSQPKTIWSKDPFNEMSLTVQSNLTTAWAKDPFESIALRNQANTGNSVFYSAPEPAKTKTSMSRTTIIRPKKQLTKSATSDNVIESVTNNNVIPVSPPAEDVVDGKRTDIPHATVLYDLAATQTGDLPLTTGQTIQLLYRINGDWLFGRSGKNEGMFPQSFVKIEVPLLETESLQEETKPESSFTARALYDFTGEVHGDLSLQEGDVVTLLGRVNEEWLSAELNGLKGLIPAVYVDHVPQTLPTVPS